MSNINKQVFNDILSKRGSGGKSSNGADILIEKDKIVRKEITELYQMLNNCNEPKIAVDLLAEHVAIMVSMINELKKRI